MAKHDQLYEAAKAAIHRLFEDQSVTQSSTYRSLQGLKEIISTMQETLDPSDAVDEKPEDDS